MAYDINQIKNKLNALGDVNQSNNSKVETIVDKFNSQINPFVRNGQLLNPYINYQAVLDNPSVTSKAKDFITQATGLTPTANEPQNTSYSEHTKESAVNFNGNADVNNLASLDVTTELPKLNANQISAIISKHFSNSPVIKPSDAEGIYNAQQKTGMSALAILSIGALESGYGTSSIAKHIRM